jgi:hypothetical protein
MIVMLQSCDSSEIVMLSNTLSIRANHFNGGLYNDSNQ